MKIIFLAISCMIAGCTTFQGSDPSTALTVERLPKACWPYGYKIPVQLIFRNRTPETIQLWVSTQSLTSPYELSWLSYQIQGEQGSIEHGPGGHGALPQNELKISPGDSARLAAFVYDLARPDYAKRFRVHITDAANNEYNTAYFTLCSS